VLALENFFVPFFFLSFLAKKSSRSAMMLEREHEVELLLVGPVLPAASEAGASLGLGSLILRRRGGGLEWRRWGSRRS